MKLYLLFQVALYSGLLEECIIKDSEEIPLIPELYAVPGDRVREKNCSISSLHRICIGIH